MANDGKQVSTRVSPEAFELLQIGLLVEGAETMQELLRPVVEAYAERLKKEAEIAEIQASTQSYRDRKRGVRRIDKKPRKKNDGDSANSTRA